MANISLGRSICPLALFLLTTLTCGAALAQEAQGQQKENNAFPPLWHLAPGNLEDYPRERNRIVINAWSYLERLGMYKILINSSFSSSTSHQHRDASNILWGLPLQHGWQFETGRLADPTDATTCGHKDGDNLCISVQSWWACMNYYLAVIPFLGALDSGILGELPYEIEILPPDGHRADFCHSIAECRAQAPNVMSAWRDFFKYQMSAAQNSDISAPHLLSEDDALKHMWEAHVYSIVFALPKFQNRLPFLSSSESSFGVAWATAVHFIAATRFPTDQNTTNHFQTGLPPRMLQEGDKAPFIPDFTPVQNRMVYMIETLHKANEKSGGMLLLLWKVAMSTEEQRKIGRSLIELLFSGASFMVPNF
ncbi:protein LEG1 homolog [Varanus komodoensis]|uniref:protein LEG1 homolog n=1 Tax=Varanus komodoensis TaxID=61221 RepID=UPI001CF7D95C|nr:protein LEG1 homolog [Varanus komodoensis]